MLELNQMKKITIVIPLVISVLSFLVAAFASPHVPYMMASHWNMSGQVNGYMSKGFGLYFIPILSLALFVLFRFLPKIDPYKQNFAQFESYYNIFVVILTLFLFYLYLLTITWNLGYRFNFIQLTVPAFSILFYYAGVLTGNSKRNWFVGIRTPWTLSSEVVWQKTHILGGKLFKLTALSILFGIIFPTFAIHIILVSVFLTVAIVYLYSYLEFQKLA